MSILFKSKREREKDQRRERRHAFRQAENAVDNVQDRIKILEKKSKEQWDKARQSLAEGHAAAANRLLVGYRAAQVIMVRLEQKRWVFEQYIEKLHAAGSDAEFAAAMEAVNKIMAIDPDKIIDAFDDSTDLLAEQNTADSQWNKLYEKEMAGAGESLQDHIPSIDELSAQLEREAGSNIAAESPEKTTPQNNANLSERISNGRQRVDKILKDSERMQ